MLLLKCECINCALFLNEEGIGWEDTHNSLFIVYCQDGKVRAIENVKKGGCPDFIDKQERN